MFNILGPRVAAARILDLFAGVGTLGLEALSRGAARADFVERSPRHAQAIRDNLQRLEFSDRGRVLCMDVMTFLKRPPVQSPPYDLAFLDPPYQGDDLARILPLPALANIIDFPGLLIVEYGTPLPPMRKVSWEIGRTYRYGMTSITLMSLPKAPSSPDVDAAGEQG